MRLMRSSLTAAVRTVSPSSNVCRLAVLLRSKLSLSTLRIRSPVRGLTGKIRRLLSLTSTAGSLMASAGTARLLAGCACPAISRPIFTSI